MKKSWIAAGLGALGLLAAGAAAISQVITVPQVVSIGPTDLFQDVVGGAPVAGNVYAPALLLGNYSTTLPGNNPDNALIGGDATTNLFQRATSGSSVTTTITYGGPDRWAYWSGTSTAMTVSQSTTAGDFPTAYKAAFKMARTSGQTGVVQMCMMQEIESVNSYQFQGQTAEIHFHAFTGANFSAAGSNMTVYLISGTGTDEGVSKAAFNLNAGGGGSSLWTGQVNTGVVVNLQGVSIAARYGVAIPVPATATELAVALCYTPVGTAGTNDYIAFSGIGLVRNNSLTTAAGAAGVALQVNDPRMKAFARRQQAAETLLQQRYYYQITEGTPLAQRALCAVSSTSLAVCAIQFPVTMRTAPTITTTTAGFSLTVGAQTSVANCVAIRASTTLTSAVASPNVGPIDCTSSAGFGAAGTVAQLYDAGQSGIIRASAEL